MSENKNTLPLEMEIENLRRKLKISNQETVEECQRLRWEIQQLYFQMARTTRPGRYAEKRNNINSRQKEDQSITPEVIPPDLDIREYFDAQKEVAAGSELQCRDNRDIVFEPSPSNPEPTTLPALTESNGHTHPASASSESKYMPTTLRERDKTIEERFAIVAERMQERRRQWLESQEKNRPWWKR